jgi:hypothetical protein
MIRDVTRRLQKIRTALCRCKTSRDPEPYFIGLREYAAGRHEYVAGWGGVTSRMREQAWLHRGAVPGRSRSTRIATDIDTYRRILTNRFPDEGTCSALLRFSTHCDSRDFVQLFLASRPRITMHNAADKKTVFSLESNAKPAKPAAKKVARRKGKAA